MDDNEVNLMLDDDETALVLRAAAKLQRGKDETLIAMLNEIESDDETEQLLARAKVADLLLPGEE